MANIQVPSLVFNQLIMQLKPSEFKVYMRLYYLAVQSGVEPPEAVVRQKDLEYWTKQTYATIRRALRSLVRAGLLELQPRRRLDVSKRYRVWIGITPMPSSVLTQTAAPAATAPTLTRPSEPLTDAERRIAMNCLYEKRRDQWMMNLGPDEYREIRRLSDIPMGKGVVGPNELGEYFKAHYWPKMEQEFSADEILEAHHHFKIGGRR